MTDKVIVRNGSDKGAEDRGQRIIALDHKSKAAMTMAVLGISWDLIFIRVCREQIPTSAALRQSSVGIRLCFIHDSDVWN